MTVKKLGFIKDQNKTRESNQKETISMYDKNIFYTEIKDYEKGYESLGVPITNASTILYDKTIEHPDSAAPIQIKNGIPKTYAWHGFLLSPPIVVETVTYPELSKQVNSEEFINKNLYRVTLPVNIYYTDEQGNSIARNLINESKYNIRLPEKYDAIRKSKEGIEREQKAAFPEKTYHFIFPVAINIAEDEGEEKGKPKIVFFAQPINWSLKKAFKDAKVTEAEPTTELVAAYLFHTLLDAKVGEPVKFFKDSKFKFGNGKNPWTGWTWKSLHGKMDTLYQKNYFNFDTTELKSKVSNEYLALLGTSQWVGIMKDKPSNGAVYFEEVTYNDEGKEIKKKILDETKSSINSLVQKTLFKLTYDALKKIEEQNKPITKDNSEAAENNFDTTGDIPF